MSGKKSQKMVEQALAARRAGDAAGAEAIYRKLLRKSHADLDGNYLLGTLLAEQGRLQEGLGYLQRAAKLDPHSAYVQTNLGNVYRLSGDLERAEKCFRRALDLKADLAEAANNLGVLLKRRGELTEAGELFQRALQANPRFADAYCNLGYALLDDNQVEAALPYFRSALELAPDFARAHEGLGTVYLKRDERDKAIVHLRRYLELMPQEPGEVPLKLARLGEAPPPERYPEDPMRATYERKAASWDRDIERPGMEFLGPQHVHSALERLGLPESALAVLDIGCGTGICGPFLRSLAKRLAGVDLSSHMLEQARAKALYDELECAELTAYLNAHPAEFDLIVASGVLILFGALTPAFRAAANALRPKGHLVFTLYRSPGADVIVRHNLHYAHSEQHVRACAATAGLAVLALEEVVHEYDYGETQPGYLVILTRR